MNRAPQRVRLDCKEMPDGKFMITSPDVPGLCVAAPTLALAEREAIEVLDFMRRSLGAPERIVSLEYAA